MFYGENIPVVCISGSGPPKCTHLLRVVTQITHENYSSVMITSCEYRMKKCKTEFMVSGSVGEARVQSGRKVMEKDNM